MVTPVDRRKDLQARPVLLVAVAALAIYSAACGWLPQPHELTPTVYAPTMTNVPPAATDTPSPAPPACPAPSSPPLPAQPSDWTGYVEASREFLSAGGAVGALEGLLGSWDALPGDGGQVQAADATGNGVDEIVVALRDPTSSYVFPSGGFYIFGCQAGEYVTLHEETTDGLELRVIQVADTNLDGVADVSYTESTCGAHTCLVSLRILGWNGAAFSNLMGGPLEMPYPAYTVSAGRIDAVSGRIGSVGAEPQRDYFEIWEWNGSIFTVTQELWGEPVYRYHALLDGDRALLEGNYLSAAGAYEMVISDEALEPFDAYYSEAEECARLAAFARWRLLLTRLQMGDPASAQSEYELLQAEYLPGRPGYDVAVMADTFWTAYAAADSVPAGCSAIVAAASAGSSVLEFLNSYGYANPIWQAADLCPF